MCACSRSDPIKVNDQCLAPRQSPINTLCQRAEAVLTLEKCIALAGSSAPVFIHSAMAPDAKATATAPAAKKSKFNIAAAATPQGSKRGIAEVGGKAPAASPMKARLRNPSLSPNGHLVWSDSLECLRQKVPKAGDVKTVVWKMLTRVYGGNECGHAVHPRSLATIFPSPGSRMRQSAHSSHNGDQQAGQLLCASTR